MDDFEGRDVIYERSLNSESNTKKSFRLNNNIEHVYLDFL